MISSLFPPVRRAVAALAAVSLASGLAACRSAPTVSGTGSRAPATLTAASSDAPATPPRSTVAPTPTPTRTDGPSSTAATSAAATTTAPSTPTSTLPHVSSAPARLSGREWTAIPTSRHVVALTFDAGGDDAGVPSILATLKRENVPATFFLTGAWVRAFPARARSICAGYRIGNHSLTHPHFTALSDAQIDAQITDAAAAMRSVCGGDPAPLFRFPFGDRDARTIAAVNAVGYVPVAWTVDTLGWEGTSGGGGSTSAVINRVVSHLQPGEIVLMHVGSTPADGSTLDADSLPGIISALRARGYGFVTLDALLL